MRQADELSITVAPALAATGLNSRLTDAGVLDRTRSTPANASAHSGSTGCSRPRNVTDRPALRGEARNLIDAAGNFRSSSTLRISSPTAPVAPTTATFGVTFQPSPEPRARRAPDIIPCKATSRG